METVTSTIPSYILDNANGGMAADTPSPMTADTNGEQLAADPDSTPVRVMDNTDPLRQRVKNPTRGLRKIISKILSRWFPKPTPEEQALLDERAFRKKLEQTLIAEARVAERRIVNRLTGMGICHVSTVSGGFGSHKQVSRVRIKRGELTPDALWFQVDISRLPFGVSTSQLLDQDTVNNLSLSVGHRVSARWTETGGIWYVVERASGMFGIPNHVNLPEMWERMPASKDSLTIPVGMTTNSTPIYMSLNEMVHVLIAGTTGGGKSNFMNVLLCTLIRRNKPDRMQLLLVDLKGGLEFNYYGGIPHLLGIPNVAPSGIVYERDGVAPLLRWVVEEGERRMHILLRAGAKNIGEYNAHRREDIMTHLVVVIDEWADVKLGKDGKKTEDMLANAVQRMRAVGIHIILATQVPQTQVIGTLIKANLPAKFAFSCADLNGSMAILNNGAAFNLQPRGRCVFRFSEQMQVQTPFISKPVILQTIKESVTGVFSVAAKTDLTLDEVLAWALRENNGYLTVSKCWQQFKHRGIIQRDFQHMLEIEGKEFMIDGTLYICTPAQGTRGRRLIVKIDDNPAPAEEAKSE